MKLERKQLQEFFNLNTIFFIICLILVTVLFFLTFQMKTLSTYLLPRLLALFCMVGILIALIVDFLKIASPSREKEEQEELEETLQGINFFYTVIFALVYFTLIPMLGFTLSTCAALIVFSYLAGYRNKKIILPLAVILPLLFRYLFVSLLQVNLPEGILKSVISF